MTALPLLDWRRHAEGTDPAGFAADLGRACRGAGIGDCLMRWTNDIYVSTPHRVAPPPRQRRSVAFFLDPNPDSRIAALPGTGAPKYPAVLAAEYLRARLDATYDPEPSP